MITAPKTKLLAIVTDDCERTMASLYKLGIGPWKLYTFDERTVTDSQYQGRPNNSALRIGVAEGSEISWEVIQPLSGEGVHQDFLRKHGEGYFHVALDLGTGDFDERLAELDRAGFRVVQSATWLGSVRYAFFESATSPGLMLETVTFPEGFAFPAPESWYPAPE